MMGTAPIPEIVRAYGLLLRVWLLEHTNNDAFDDFPKIPDHHPKIFRNFSKGKRDVSGNFPNIFQDFLGGTNDVSTIQQHI